jgi:hypothetical protein
MTIEELIAREEIRVLLATYHMGGDQGRLDRLASVFAPDGVLKGRQSWTGPAEIERNLGGVRTKTDGPDRPLEFIRHMLGTSMITFDDPATARGRTYFLAVTEIGPDHMGVYVDRIEKRGDKWLIAEREVRIDWVAENGHVQSTRRPREKQAP